MSKLRVESFGISLDGYSAGPGQDLQNPLGINGPELMELMRQQAVNFFRYTLSTRLDDPKRDAIVVVMQRLHTGDLTAICLEQGFEHVYSSDQGIRLTNGFVWPRHSVRRNITTGELKTIIDNAFGYWARCKVETKVLIKSNF